MERHSNRSNHWHSFPASICLPPACVTGIGSLPMSDPIQAVEFVTQSCPELPFWPQLPQRDWREAMTAQSLGSFLSLMNARSEGFGFTIFPPYFDQFIEQLRDGPAKLEPDCAAGFFAFEEASASGAFLKARAVKGQIAGPITLAFHLFRGEECFATDPVLLSALARYILRLAQWQIDRLAKSGLPVVLFIDEPALPLAERPQGKTKREDFVATLARLVQEIQKSGAVVGLHCCGKDPFQMMLEAEPDIFSFDAHRNLEALFDSEPGCAILRKQPFIAFGLVPTLKDFDGFTSESLLKRWRKATRHQSVSDSLLPKSLFTATCGLGLVNEKVATDSFRIAHELSQHLRSRAHLIKP